MNNNETNSAALRGSATKKSAREAEIRRLVDGNQGLVKSEAARVLEAWIPENDPDAREEWFRELVQAGQPGLRRAAKKFDPARGTAFSTYAVPWIRKYVRKAAEELRETYFHVSVDAPAGGAEGAAELVELLADEDAESPAEAVERADRRAWGRELLAVLPARERRVVERRFGLDGGPERTFAEMAGDEGVSVQCIHRVFQRALARMRRAAA